MADIELKIDPKFRDKIPPLSEDEFRQLQSNILDDGEVYEPIVVWNGTIVDGHNRWKIIQAHPEIPYRVKEMDFVDEWAAYEWMYKKQLGRRNLTDEQRTYMIGKMYEARKNTIGGDRGNQYTKLAKRQNGALPHGKTSIQIAKELNVGQKTVERAEKFAQGVDVLRELSPESADKVLEGKTEVTKKQVMDIVKNWELRQRVKEAIEKGEPIHATTMTKQPPKTLTLLPSSTTESRSVQLPSEPSSTESSPYNLDDFIEEVRMQGDDFINSVRIHIETRFVQFDGEPARIRLRNIIDAIQEELTILKGEWQ